MNKIFKVIFDHATQSFVVVSELAKSRGKRTASQTVLTTAAVAVIGLSAAGDAAAANNWDLNNRIFFSSTFVGIGDGVTRNGSKSVVIGSSAQTGANLDNGVIIGHNAGTLVSGGVAIGKDALVEAGSTHSVAIGQGARVRGGAAQSTAVGANAETTGRESVAFGQNAKAKEGLAVAVGAYSNATKTGATAVGRDTNATGQWSLSVGHYAQALDENASALGAHSVANRSGATAVGRSAAATGVDALASGRGSKAEYEFATAVGAYSKASAPSTAAFGRNAEAVADSATAAGVYSEAKAVKASAFGRDAKAESTQSTALGAYAKAKAAGATAIGQGAESTQANSVALGNDSRTTAATGTAKGTVANISYGGFAGATPKGVVSVGGGSVGQRQIQNVAAGQLSASSTDAINGSQLFVVAQNLTHAGLNFLPNDNNKVHNDLNTTLSIVGSAKEKGKTYSAKNVTTEGDNTSKTLTIKLSETPSFTNVTTGKTVVGDTGLTITGGPSVLVGGINAGNKVISNVADGTENNHAVNLSQLKANTSYVLAGSNIAGVDVKTNTTTGGRDFTVHAKGAAVELANQKNGLKLEAVAGNATNGNVTTYKLGIDVDGSSIVVNNEGKLTATSTAPQTTNLTITDGKVVEAPDNDTNAQNEAKKLVNASTVAKAINNVSFKAKVAKGDEGGFTDGSGSEEEIKAGGSITMKSGKNLIVKKEANATYTYATKDEVNFTSVTTGDTVLNGSGLTITGGPSVLVGGINAGNKVISNVAPGANGTDAVNVNQLNASVNNVMMGFYNRPTANGADSTLVAATPAHQLNFRFQDGIIGTFTTENGKRFVTVSLDKNNLPQPENPVTPTPPTPTPTPPAPTPTPGNNVNVEAGNNIGVVASGPATDKTFTIHGKDTTVSNGSDYIQVTPGTPVNNTTNYAVDLSEGTKNKIDNALSSWTAKVNGNETVKTINKDDSVLNFQAGDNIVISAKNNSVEVATAKDVSFDNVTIGDVNINKDSGINAGNKKISNVADGEGNNDAVNVSQLKANTSYVLAGSNIAGVDVKTNTTTGGRDFTVHAKGAAVELANQKNGLTLETVAGNATNGNVTTYKLGINVDGSSITINENGQLTATGIAAPQTTNLTVKNGKVVEANPNNATAVAEANKLVNASTVAKAINNVSFTAKVAAGDEGGFTDGSGSDEEIRAGNSITMKSGKNLIVKKEAGGVFTYAMKDMVMVGEKGKDGRDGVDGSIGASGKDGSSVVLNGKDGSIGLTGPKGRDGKDGASANLKVENGRADLEGAKGKDGKDGEAKTRIVYQPVDGNGNPKGNPEQVATLNDGLRFAGDDSNVEVKRPLNSRLDVLGGADKNKLTENNIGVVADATNHSLTVKLSKDVDLGGNGSVKIDSVTINNQGIDAGDKRITNVKPGRISANSKDAVNGSQLHGVVKNVNKLDKRVRGIGASSAAAASLPQVYIPGKSMVAAAAGGYAGASAVSVGYSRASDNGKLILKMQGSANSQGHISGGVGVGYQW